MPLVVSGASLAPSNAASSTFPNLARHVETLSPEARVAVYAEVDGVVRQELEAAGLPFGQLGDLNNGAIAMGDWNRKGEVPTDIVGFWKHWKFERAWYYYRASGAGIPPNFAIPFDEKWGKVVRADGDCACQGSAYWAEGFAMGNYHIDTQEGLNAFVEMLNQIHVPRGK